MGALTSAIQRNDVSGLAHLIVRRLGGDHLDCPIATTTESAPRDIIVELFQDRANVDCLERALELVLDPEAFNQVKNIQRDPNRTDSLFWLCELFSLIEELRCSTPSSSLWPLCRAVAFLDAENPLHRQMQVTSLRAYAACGIDRNRLVQLFAPAFTNLDTARDFAYAMAGSAPSEFLSVLAPHLLASFADLQPTGHKKLEFVSDVIRNAIAAIRSKDQDPINQDLNIFLQHAADMASHSSGPVIREAVSAALSRSRVPFKELQKFEQRYWDAHPTIDVLKNEDFEAGRSALKDLIQTKRYFEPKQPWPSSWYELVADAHCRSIGQCHSRPPSRDERFCRSAVR